MQNSRQTILAINPGTRYIGIAVLKGSDLIDWGVKVIDGRDLSVRLTKSIEIISKLIAEYQPSVMVLKQPHPSRTSHQLDELCRRITVLARENGLGVCRFAIKDVKEIGPGTALANKTKLAEHIACMYPALQRTLNREKRASNPYNIRMFEAVALGLAAELSLRSKKN